MRTEFRIGLHAVILATACLISCAKQVPVIEAEHLHSVGSPFHAMRESEMPDFARSKTYPGGQSSGDGYFLCFSSNMELDQEGNVYIVDPARVQMFDAEGKFVKSFAPDEALRGLSGNELYERMLIKAELHGKGRPYNRLDWFDDETLIIQSMGLPPG